MKHFTLIEPSSPTEIKTSHFSHLLYKRLVDFLLFNNYNAYFQFNDYNAYFLYIS